MVDRRSLAVGGLIAAVAVAACADRRSQPAGAGEAPSAQLDSLRCGGVDERGRCQLYDVSVYELLANPATFHGRRVRVLGFAHLEFEGNALYPHREDLEHHLLRNGLWLSAPAGVDSVSDHYAIVEGRFNANDHGHMGMWSGALDSVTRLERWELRR